MNEGEKSHELRTDILIAGGSFGGVSAALAAADLGRHVILTEETSWIGGQATTQGVPLDEHPWIEQYGGNRSYRQFRDGVRQYYRQHYPLSAAARRDPLLNPGAAWVTGLAYEPTVGLAVLQSMLAPHVTAGRIRILLRHLPVAVACDGDRIVSVSLRDETSGLTRHIRAELFLDATELGDLLEPGGVEHVAGAESQEDTGEPNAYGEADPLRQQGFTHLVAVDHLPGEDHVIERPREYDRFRQRFQHLQGWLAGDANDNAIRMRRLFASDESDRYQPSIWNFRRYFCRGNFGKGTFPSDITGIMVGEYREGPLVGVSPDEVARHRELARQLSLSAIHFFQTEIEPGYEGGRGFPGIRLRGDALGSDDGLAQYPYIRESRRIVPEFRVLEQHFHIGERPDGPEVYDDSVGLGGYRVDIHEKRKHSSFTQELHRGHWPQQIPLGCLIPLRVENLLAACKNVGTTHITNGAFRLHPVEWNIGEAAGTLAAYCLDRGESPRSVRHREAELRDFQRLLVRRGVELAWPRLEPARSYNSHYVDFPDWYWGEAWRR